MIARVFITLCTLLAIPSLVAAQCPSPATGLSAQTGACSIRLTWTPQVANALTQTILRAPTDNIAAAVEIQTVLPTTSEYVDLTPVRGTFYFYWIRTTLITPQCQLVTSASVRTALSNSAALVISAEPSCNGITVTVAPVFDATSYIYIRADENRQNPIQLGSSAFTTFTDTTAIPGRTYHYGCLPQGPCGGPATTAPSNPVQSGVADFTPPLSPSIIDAGQSLSIQTSITAVSPFTIAWTRDGVPLSDTDARLFGLGTENLTIFGARTSDTGLYRAVVTNSCGTFTSDPILVAIRPGCRADFDENGTLAPADIFSFLNTWFAGCP